MTSLPQGIYEALLDEELNSILQRHPELRSVFGKLDPEEAFKNGDPLRPCLPPSRGSLFGKKALAVE